MKLAVQPTPPVPTARYLQARPHRGKAPHSHPTYSPPPPSRSHLFHLLPWFWVLCLQLWLRIWLLVFLHIFFSLGFLWQLLIPFSCIPLSKIVQSFSPNLAAVLGKDELCLGYKTWVGRGKEDLLVFGTHVLYWGYLFMPVCIPVYPGTMLELSLSCPRLTGRLLLGTSGDLGGRIGGRSVRWAGGQARPGEPRSS